MLRMSALEIETLMPSHTISNQQANRRGSLFADGVIGRLTWVASG
jgi:hypothetical protein